MISTRPGRHEARPDRRARGEVLLEERPVGVVHRAEVLCVRQVDQQRRTSAGEQPAAPSAVLIRASVSFVCAPASPLVSVVAEHARQVDAIAGADRGAQVRVRGTAVIDDALRRRRGDDQRDLDDVLTAGQSGDHRRARRRGRGEVLPVRLVHRLERRPVRQVHARLTTLANVMPAAARTRARCRGRPSSAR